MDKQNLPLGILGGTFDPIHFGHILPAQQAAEQLGLSQVLLIPCHIPPHKPQPVATSEQRLAMLQAVCNEYPMFAIEDWELKQSQPSYSLHTLTMLRERHPDQPLCFFIGMDSLINFTTWHRWQDILTLTNLVVFARPGYSPEQVPEILQPRVTMDTDISTLAGNIHILDIEPVDASSTQIRSALKSGKSPGNTLPEAIYPYIRQHNLYRS